MLVLKALINTATVLLCLLAAAFVHAQSLDARSPSAVRSNEIVGRIAARDLGDSRLTDHFYAFTGTPGDLLVTIETQNLNGDIDVFTAGALRPVLKVAVYAEIGAPVSKSIYLRQREDLILRIEARSPNDDDGIYHIRFGGSFEPIAGTAEAVEEITASETPSAQPRKGRRVSSVGARIEEPAAPVEVAAAPTPEPTPAATPEAPAAEPKVEAPTEPAPKPSSSRSRASSRRSRNKTREEKTEPTVTATTVEPKAVEGASKAEPNAASAEAAEPATKKAASKKSKSTTKKAAEVAATSEAESPPSRTVESKVAENPEKAPEPQGESKLIIEMLDGSRIERSMTLIRRVTIESGQIVVTGTDGNVDRIRLARVMRMSIGQ